MMRFSYKGVLDNKGICEIERIGNLIIATEIDDNPGPSVTNAAEGLAKAACDFFGIDPYRLIQVESYEYDNDKTYDLVSFHYDECREFHDVSWQRISKGTVDLMVAEQNLILKNSRAEKEGGS